MNSSTQLQTIGIEVGRRIHYPGDVANHSSDGIIVAVSESAQRFDSILFDGRVIRGTSFHAFTGLRPWRALDRVHGSALIDAMHRKVAEVQTNHAIEKAAAEHALQAAGAALIAAYPHLQVIDAAKPHDGNLVGRNLRALLKAEGIKASVRKDGYSAYYVKLPADVDAARFDELSALCRRFQAGSFDGMTDSYEYRRSAWTETFGGVKYVFVSRERAA